MFTNRNVPRWERAARVVAGIVAAVGGYLYFRDTPAGWLVAGSGIILVVTGIIGFCPACALVGRRPTDLED